MSDAEQVPREWRFYVQDMIGFAGKVIGYTDGLTQEKLVADDSGSCPRTGAVAAKPAERRRWERSR